MKKYFSAKKTLIVAEIGNNHEGSISVAKNLILEAKKAGVDAVKFQTYNTLKYVNIKNKKRFNQLKKFELNKKNFIELSKFTKKNGLKFISTPFDLESADFLENIVDLFKISSGDNNFQELIKKVLSKKKPTIISTGLLNLREIKKLINFVNPKISKSKVCFLHCVSAYPVKSEEANLFAIDILNKKYKVNTGYSDHTIGKIASIVAVSKEAKIIEKHFTLDNNFSNFRDHKISLNPSDMKDLVNSIREIEKMNAKKKEKYSKDEQKNFNNMRRSIYSKKIIKKGNNLKKDDIKIVRPFVKGSNPNTLEKIIGKKTIRTIYPNEIIKTSFFK